MLPKHLPPLQTVYWWFRRLVLVLFCQIHNVALMLDCERAEREGSPRCRYYGRPSGWTSVSAPRPTFNRLLALGTHRP